jgi:hypothetical protein
MLSPGFNEIIKLRRRIKIWLSRPLLIRLVDNPFAAKYDAEVFRQSRVGVHILDQLVMGCGGSLTSW